jgi:hypothetical protein
VPDARSAAADDAFEEFATDRARIARSAKLAYEDDWRFRTVVDEAMRADSDDQAAAIAFHLRTKPEIYGVLRGSRGLFGWDRHRRRTLSAVADMRRDVLTMRHAVKERHALYAREKRGFVAQLIAAGDAVLAAESEPPSIADAAGPPRAAPSDEPDLHRARLQLDREETSVIVEMVVTAEETLAFASETTNSAAKSAQLARIGEAFAKARAVLSDEDRRENTLSPPRTKRSRARKTP